MIKNVCNNYLPDQVLDLHIMIRHSVDSCKIELHFMPLTIFNLNSLLLMMKMKYKTIFISFVKN